MANNNLFQGASNQMSNNQDFYMNNRPNPTNWSAQNVQPPMPNYLNRPSSSPLISVLPGRVVFSPEQISPQEIPSNGSPALFPLSDGSCIIVKALSQNGTFDEQRYVLESKEIQESIPQQSEFEQVMNKLNKLESSVDSILNDLYGTKSESIEPKEE